MYRLVLMALISTFSFSAFSQIKWSDISKGSKLKFTQGLQLETIQAEKSFQIPNGTIVVADERVNLGMINVELFKMTLADCRDNSARAEMQLFDVAQPNGKVVTAGVELTGNCQLEIFIETRDMYSLSFFK